MGRMIFFFAYSLRPLDSRLTGRPLRKGLTAVRQLVDAHVLCPLQRSKKTLPTLDFGYVMQPVR